MLRDARIVAYFRRCLPRELDIATYNELVQNLAALPAYKLSLSRVKVIRLHCQESYDVPRSLDAAVIGLGISSCTPTSGENAKSWCLELCHSLNAAIVGLGISSCIPTSGDNVTPWCIGLGKPLCSENCCFVSRIVTHRYLMTRMDCELDRICEKY